MQWTIADPHLCPRTSGHYANITRYENRPDDWDELFRRRWNETVGDDDLVVVLGDFALASKEFTAEWVSSLKGRKHLLLGNHDGNRNRMLEAGFEKVYGSRKQSTYPDATTGRTQFWMPWETEGGVRVALSHAPLAELPAGCVLNYHGHIHANGYSPMMGGQRPWHRNVSVEVVDWTPVPLVSRWG